MTLTNTPRIGRKYYDAIKGVEYIADPVEITSDITTALDTKVRKTLRTIGNSYTNQKVADAVLGNDAYRYVHALDLPVARSAGQSYKVALVSPEGIVGAVGDVPALFSYAASHTWVPLPKPIVIPSGWFLVVEDAVVGYHYLFRSTDKSFVVPLKEFPDLTEGESIDLDVGSQTRRVVYGVLRSTALQLGRATIYNSAAIPPDQLARLQAIHVAISHSEASAVPVRVVVRDLEGNIISESPIVPLTDDITAIQIKFSQNSYAAAISGGVLLLNLPGITSSSNKNIIVDLETTTQETSVPIPVAVTATYTRTYRLQP